MTFTFIIWRKPSNLRAATSEQLDTLMGQLFSTSVPFRDQNAVGKLPQMSAPAQSHISFFYHLSQIELKCTLWGLFKSAFSFRQTINTPIKVREWRMNHWAWEITITGCSLSHLVPEAIWESYFRCVYSSKWSPLVWAEGASLTWQISEWLLS